MSRYISFSYKQVRQIMGNTPTLITGKDLTKTAFIYDLVGHHSSKQGEYAIFAVETGGGIKLVAAKETAPDENGLTGYIIY